jgi:molybdopterin-guanine dinucleotide biosynthesis protein A
VDDLTAFILAGGKSTRMGEEKAFLRWRGRTLLEHSLRLARSLSPEVLIVGSAAKFGGYGAVVEDVFRERGPLAGIHAALQASATDLNLILAVDLPLVELRLLKYLVVQARASTALVTLARADGGWQPLCAVYRRSFADLAERSLRAGKNKIDALFLPTNTRVIEEDELAKRHFSAEMFRNLNTPEDLKRLQKRRA